MIKKFLIIISTILITNTGIKASNLPDFVDVVKAEKAKVVHISTTTVNKNIGNQLPIPKQFLELFPNLPQQQKDSKALGSGFFFSDDGFIVTNNHVIKEADKIEVILSNNETFPAKVIGFDERTDLALLKIEANRKFSAVRWGDSSKVEVGQWVIAIGNPLGLDQTVTAGIISAKDRDILGGTAYGQFLQTDAAINFGNSGGPLLNQNGEVIGINTAIAGGQGLGFAIPSNLALKIIDQLKSKGKVTRSWLGVNIQELDNELLESLKLKSTQRGVLITQVFPDSPAAKAGLKEQDIVISVNDNKITRSTELQQSVAETTPGQKVKLGVLRDGKLININVTVVEFKDEFVNNQNASESPLGLSVETVTPKLKSQYNLSVTTGVLVTEVDDSSPLSDKLTAGDVILKIDNKDVVNVSGFKKLVSEIKSKQAFVILINRFGKQLIIPGKTD